LINKMPVFVELREKEEDREARMYWRNKGSVWN
jgi:hypothetical protein